MAGSCADPFSLSLGKAFLIIGENGCARASLVLVDQARPVGGDAAGSLAVPRIATRPDTLLEARLHLFVVRALRGATDFERTRAATAREFLDDLADVTGLLLHHEDDRAAPEVRVRAVDQKHVREPGHRHAQMGAGTVCPLGVQIPPVASGDGHRSKELSGLEPGAVNDDIRLV